MLYAQSGFIPMDQKYQSWNIKVDHSWLCLAWPVVIRHCVELATPGHQTLYVVDHAWLCLAWPVVIRHCADWTKGRWSVYPIWHLGTHRIISPASQWVEAQPWWSQGWYCQGSKPMLGGEGHIGEYSSATRRKHLIRIYRTQSSHPPPPPHPQISPTPPNNGDVL